MVWDAGETLGEDIGEKFDQDLQAFLGVEMIHSLLQGFQLLVDEVLQDRPQLPCELLGVPFCLPPNFLPVVLAILLLTTVV